MPLMKLPSWARAAFGMKGKKKQSQLSEEKPKRRVNLITGMCH